MQESSRPGPGELVAAGPCQAWAARLWPLQGGGLVQQCTACTCHPSAPLAPPMPCDPRHVYPLLAFTPRPAAHQSGLRHPPRCRLSAGIHFCVSNIELTGLAFILTPWHQLLFLDCLGTPLARAALTLALGTCVLTQQAPDKDSESCLFPSPYITRQRPPGFCQVPQGHLGVDCSWLNCPWGY